MVVAETLHEPRRQPLNSLQTIGVSNKVLREGLHSVLDGAEPTCYRGGANADTDSSANDHLIRLALEAASLQWLEGEKELSMRTPRFVVTVLSISGIKRMFISVICVVAGVFYLFYHHSAHNLLVISFEELF